jgi:hypothetical protein
MQRQVVRKMVIVFFAVLALSIGYGVWDHRNKVVEQETSNPARDRSKTAGSPTSNPSLEGDVLSMCEAEGTFCSQEYSPKTCTLTANGVTLVAAGGNACEAMVKLKSEFCSKSIRSVTRADFETRKCVDAE